MKAQTFETNKKGCGCADSGNCKPGACDCKSGEASCGCNEGLLLRPRFFAGQLLTDDDLQALTNYVVSSKRMHNKFIVGDGVSCGLAVTCHPCDDGSVVVKPGHAVDCCGNEILLPCSVELDINAMVRELKFNKNGYDCGDPCGEKAALPEKAPIGAAARERGRIVADDASCGSEGKKYCLYLNYCETLTDPVTPYTQDDKCAVTCEPSRVHEGYSFELRCPSEETDPPSIVDRIECCIGNLREADLQSAEFDRAQYQIKRGQVAQTAYQKKLIHEFSNADRKLVLSGESQLSLLQGNTSIEATAEIDEDMMAGEAKDPEVLSSELALRKSLDNMHNVGAATARFHAQNDEIKAEMLTDVKLAEALEVNRGVILKLAPKLAERSRMILKSPVELKTADAVVEATLLYTEDNAQIDRASLQAQHYLTNTVYASAANIELANALRSFKSWLVRKLDECPPTGQCCLNEEIASIVIPNDDNASDALILAAEKLANAFIRYLLDCICSALLPPCHSCDDPGVKLACLEIKDCKVDNICNLERKFLLTENNLRYWIPFIHSIGEALEKVCCDFSKKIKLNRRSDNEVNVESVNFALFENSTQNGFFQSNQQVGNKLEAYEAFPRVLSIAGILPETVKAGANIGANFGSILAREPAFSNAIPKLDLGVSDNISEAAVDKLLANETAKKMINVAAKESVANIEKKIESLAIDGTRIIEEAQLNVDTRIGGLEKRMADNITSKGLSATKVIKDMKKELDLARSENSTLEKRLAKLEKGAKS
ncbi:MAG: hypothetical protein QNK15_08725 [Cycloclasticus sp.]|nr:hypothetical protein [Cycloclasticus sp.]